jgi:hypothetical protein
MYNRIIKWFRSFFVNSTIKEQEDMRELDLRMIRYFRQKVGKSRKSLIKI